MIEATPSNPESAAAAYKRSDLNILSEAHRPAPYYIAFDDGHAEGTVKQNHDRPHFSVQLRAYNNNERMNVLSPSRKRIKVPEIQEMDPINGGLNATPKQDCTIGETKHQSLNIASKSRLNRHRALQGFHPDASRLKSGRFHDPELVKHDHSTALPGDERSSVHEACAALSDYSKAMAEVDGNGKPDFPKPSVSCENRIINAVTNSSPGRNTANIDLYCHHNAFSHDLGHNGFLSSNASSIILQESLQLISEALNSPIKRTTPGNRSATEDVVPPIEICDSADINSVVVQNSRRQSFDVLTGKDSQSCSVSEPKTISDVRFAAIHSSGYYGQPISGGSRARVSLRDSQFSSRRDLTRNAEDYQSSSRAAASAFDSAASSSCEMPCDCRRCFFASKGSHLHQIFHPLKAFGQDNASNDAYSSSWSSTKIDPGSSSWSKSQNRSERSDNKSSSRSNTYHHWRGDDSKTHRSSHRDDSPKRPSRRDSSSYDYRDKNGSSSQNRSSFISRWDVRSSNSRDIRRSEYSHSRLMQNELNDHQSADKRNSIESKTVTISALNATSSQIPPIKRVLSAAEKQAILANAKFSMKTPVLSSAAIPRLDEDHRPRRPLVRPVYSSPSARLNIRPARLVAYRSETNRIKEDAVDPDDELCLSQSDEVPIVNDEDVDVTDDIDVPDGGFRYIRFAKGRVGVQLISYSSPSTNVAIKGVYSDMVYPRSRRSNLLPLPVAIGAEMLNEDIGFKLPFAIVHSRLAEMELDVLRRTGTFLTNPPPFFLTNRNIRLPTTILPEYAGGDEILDCQCPVDIEPGCGSNCINRLTHVECEPDQCKLGDACTNQRFQKRQWSKLTVEYMGEKGWGLCLAQDVRQGDLIIEYVGELIDLETCKERCRNEYRSERHFYLLSLYKNIIIDATRRGNIGRFCNHSCEPTCETQKWSVRGSPRIGILARRDLPKGTEVTLDYNFEQIGLTMTKCLCGSESCRGFLGVPKSKRRKETFPFDLEDYDIIRDGPPILHPDEQVLQISEYLNLNQLPDAFLSMISDIGPESLYPALLLRNVVRVHASFMDRLEYSPDPI